MNFQGFPSLIDFTLSIEITSNFEQKEPKHNQIMKNMKTHERHRGKCTLHSGSCPVWMFYVLNFLFIHEKINLDH